MKKIILPEAILTMHFMDRLNERLPNFIRNDSKYKNEVLELIGLVKDTTFPNGRFLVTLKHYKKLILQVVIDNNKIVTVMFSDRVRNCLDCFYVLDLKKMRSELAFISGSSFPKGNYYYEYVENGESFYFLIKNGTVIKTLKQEDLTKYPEYKKYVIN